MRILVVDDSRTMRLLVIRALRQAGYDGYDIVEASDGLEALEVIGSVSVDLVLCDWNMPRMSGIELLKSLRGSGDLRLFGFITSESNPAMRQLAATEGAAFVMSKPFTAESIQSVLGGSEGDRKSLMHLGLPTVTDLDDLLAPLLGRGLEITASSCPVPLEYAAVTWDYVFRSGVVAAAGALDLPSAAAMGAGFGLMPKTRVLEALDEGKLPDALLENLHELLNVLVALYSSMSDEPMSLGEVQSGWVEGSKTAEILTRTRGRLDANIELSGYGRGQLSMVFAGG